MRIHTRRAAGRARGAVAAAVLALPVAASVLAAVPAGAGALSGHMPASAGLALAGSMQTGQAGAGSLVPGRPGTQRWVARYAGPTGRFGYDEASSVMVSPDGDTVFVAGTSTGASSGEDYVTVAYRAATGAQLWLKRYDGPGYSYNSSDQALSAAVSPAGDLVFVTGRSQGRAWGVDYATVAYDAATGAQRWVARYHGPARGPTSYNVPWSVAVSPAGDTVYVTGESVRGGGEDYATVAYDAATGAQRWVARYHGRGGALSVTVSPGGDAVFVTGFSYGRGSNMDYATVAYDAVTGAQRWVARYNGPANRLNMAASVAVSPAGDTVFVTGHSEGRASGFDYATVAYDAVTGAQRWVARYNGPGNSFDAARLVAVSLHGNTVYVTGSSAGRGPGEAGYDYATVAYNAVTGAQRWVARYNGPGNSDDAAFSMAVSPHGNTVYVTGSSAGRGSGQDYATVAYKG